MVPALKQMRYVVAVANEGSFSRAAESLHVAQQAISQQVRQVEKALGVQLFERTVRGVKITPAGEVFVQEAQRTLSAADRIAPRVQAAARGEAGTLRIAYTLSTVYETLPALLHAIAEDQPELKLRPQEVFGADVEDLLQHEQFDLALAPRMTLRPGLEHRPARHEEFVVALPDGHPLSRRKSAKLAAFAEETLEVWPRHMAPGYYDAVMAACRAAGFEPQIAEEAAGSTVWGDIADAKGFGLVVGSLRHQVPAGLTLVDLEPPAPALTIDLIWSAGDQVPGVRPMLEAAERMADERHWL